MFTTCVARGLAPGGRLIVLLLLAWLWHPVAWAAAPMAAVQTTAAQTNALQTAAVHLSAAQVGVSAAPASDVHAVPAVVTPADLPATWQPVHLPHAQRHDIVGQAAQALAGPQGWVVTWYRIPIPPSASAGGAPAAAGAPPMLKLYGARAKAYGPIAIYFDGQRIAEWQVDEVPWYWAPFWLPVTVPAPSLGGGPHELLVRMAHPAHTRTALASVWLGPADALAWRYWGRELLQKTVPALGGGAFLAVGLFAFFVWWRGARDRVFLLFTALGVASFIRGLHYHVDLPVSNELLGWLTVNALFWLIVLVHHLQMRLHQVHMPRINALLHAVVALVFVLTLPWVGRIPNTPDFSPLIYVLAMLTSPLVAAVGVRLSWGRSTEGMLIATSVVLGTLFGFNDWAIQNNLLGPESWYLGPYANIVNFGVFSALMFRRYLAAMDAVRQSHAVLAQRLADKEAELHASYERLRDIERAQTLASERTRLTQDMHDGLGSSLHTALRAVERGEAQSDDVAEILRGCIDDLYITLDSMEPAHTDLLLLLGTLRHRLTSRLRQAGVKLLWGVQDLPPLPWMDPRRSLHIMRILQEAITNSLKHAQADTLILSTHLHDDGVSVRLRDNGCGFDVGRIAMGPTPGQGRGLHNQRRRAEAIGGRIHWDSGPEGTTTTLWLPLTMPA